MQFLRKTQGAESGVKHRQEPRQAGREEAPGALAAPPTRTPAPSAWPCPLPHGAPRAARPPPALGPGRASRLRGGKLPSPLDKETAVTPRDAPKSLVETTQPSLTGGEMAWFLPRFDR
ncbi:translation initiation factor IF-2-like [Cervus elaphus]|uniref:translation initiation factor IF-2-like n=1 Tax=Cervus canadensis TaxID=1574408 RepID=UPI001CA341DB|nr:translation initiation factor IF-2-like [Cervus canadensis]XP_043744364.1 translation initiation factor IF-2-like [Cervus elaphus]